MYDKFSKILRIETTSNNISFFRRYREVVRRDGTKSNKIADLKKNIYSLVYMTDILKASNKRYHQYSPGTSYTGRLSLTFIFGRYRFLIIRRYCE
ncbi:MAG: hypothetical protein LBG80_02985 [Bacteroidales bacterium]|nr:hypothetical protein [Bacteroidales bacterium]